MNSRMVLGGVPRFLAYLSLQLALLSLPLAYLAIPAAIIALLGIAEGQSWAQWARRSRIVLIVAAMPALFGIPWNAASFASACALWTPPLARSARLALVFASASWLSSRMTHLELRDTLDALLKPLGRATASHIARAVSLTVAFIPWTRLELRRADEAARLRGSNLSRRPVGHLAALS
ncbi:MAG: hypothetical protein JXM71_01955, partial [Spirochaetales bacterium]|nr:hypothetical protein [Spirochaetales bacterium]